MAFTSSRIAIAPPLSHSIRSQSMIDELQDLLLYTLGGNWNGVENINTLASWTDSTLDSSGKHLRTVSYNMFVSASRRSCLSIPPAASSTSDDLIAGECASTDVQSWKVGFL
jgi:hypothetical protein